MSEGERARERERERESARERERESEREREIERERCRHDALLVTCVCHSLSLRVCVRVSETGRDREAETDYFNGRVVAAKCIQFLRDFYSEIENIFINGDLKRKHLISIPCRCRALR